MVAYRKQCRHENSWGKISPFALRILNFRVRFKIRLRVRIRGLGFGSINDVDGRWRESFLNCGLRDKFRYDG